MDDRRSLINSLAHEFGQASDPDLKIDKSNFIDDSRTLDCTAMGLPVDTLRKTLRVVEQHVKKFRSSDQPEKAQYVAHLDVARKCIEEVILLKSR